MKPLTGACYIPPLVILISVTSYFIAVTDASTVVVDSPFGRIQGVEKTDGDTGLSYVSFKGIPYAKPPVGDLRFAKPEPHPKIGNVFDATKDDQIMCPFPAPPNYEITGLTEDCLVLNIMTKDINPSSNFLKKVMVFIHGGGFSTGSSYLYDAKSFVYTQGIIVVTINYRLGILGFLSTENEASPGNYGLWDQTLALRWVKDNIRTFGGDPDDVTISGNSAGGASVGHQSLSPHTTGLFTKAYLQSGTATSHFAMTTNALLDAMSFAKNTGCWAKNVDCKLSLEESNAVMKCLRQLPMATFKSFNALTLDTIHFAPRVDGDFIPKLPADLLEDDAYLDSIRFFDRSYMVGVDNNEAGFLASLMLAKKGAIFANKETSTEEKELTWQEALTETKDLYFSSRLGQGAWNNDTVSKIDDFYNRRFDSFSATIQMMSDLNFLIPALDFVSAAARRKSCNAYLFYFNHFPQYMQGSEKGIIHGVDTFYWFDGDVTLLLNAYLGGGIGERMAEDDLELKTLFSSIVGEFTQSGNPGMAIKHGWPRYDDCTSYYLDLNPIPWVYSALKKPWQDLWFTTVPSLLKDQQRHVEL